MTRTSSGKIVSAAVAIGLAVLVWSASTGAQELPPSLDPGRIDERFEPPLAPESVPEVDLPAPEQAPPPDEAERVRFTLERLVFEGNTVLSDQELRPLYAPLLGTEVTLARLYELRDAITAAYRARGYLLSQAVIPAQRISGGQVRIVIIEGFVDRVTFDGDAVTDHRGLLDELAAKIVASRPLEQKVLERYVLLINDLHGVRARSVLRPADGVSGGAVLAVVVEKSPLDGRLRIDNRGSAAIGPYQGDAAFGINNQFGLFERLSVRGIVTSEVKELRYLDVRNSMVVNSEGTEVTVGGRFSFSDPGSEVEQFEIESFNGTLTLGVSHPFIRSRSESLYGSASFTYRHSSTDAAGSLLTLDKLRVLKIGGTYDFADRFQGSNIIELELARGLDIFGASEEGSANLTRSGGQVDFTKVTFGARRNQPLSEEVQLVFATEGQYSPDELLSSEEFGLGGRTFGRAYDSSEITGDIGLVGRIEAQYTLDGSELASLIGVAAENLSWLNTGQVYAFADGGAVRNYEAGTRHGWQNLSSLGAGLRMAVADRFSVDLQMARPMSRDTSVNGNRDLRWFFSLTGRY